MRWSGRLAVAGLLALGPVAAGSVSATAASPSPMAVAAPAASDAVAHPAGGYWQEEGRYSNEPDCRAMANSPLLSGRSDCILTDRYQDPWTLFVYYYT